MRYLETLSARWRKATKSQKVLTLSLASLLVAALFYTAVVEPFLAYYSSLKEELKKQKLLNEKYKNKVSELPKLKEEVKRLEEKFRAVEKKFFTEKTETLAFSVFKDKVSAYAKDSGIKEESVSKLSSLDVTGAKKLRLRGNYKTADLKKLLNFMLLVERGEEKVMGFESVTIILDTYKGEETYYLSAEIFGLWIH